MSVTAKAEPANADKKPRKPKTKLPKIRPAAPLDVNRLYDIQDTLTFIPVCRSLFLREVKAGRIKVVRIGRRLLTPGHEIARLSRPEAAAA